MAYLKNEFETWIKTAKRDNGEPYSTETINNYIGVIKNYCKKLNNLSVESTDLFNVDDAYTFERIHEEILKHPDFERVNRSYHRAFSSGLLVYRRFLQLRGASAMENLLSFEEWLTNYREHKYRDSTIKRYIVALQKAEERLSIVLDRPILEIKDLKEFEKAVEKIQTSPNYDFVNKKYGNGDLSAALSAYTKYLKDILATNDLWWPSREEYDPGFSKEKWIELLNDSNIFTESALEMMAEFYAYGGTATCAQLAEYYQRTYNYYLMTSVHLAERIVKATGCPVVEEEKNAQNAKWWPVLYVGKDASKEEKGTFIWKIREELYEALTEYGIEKHLAERENSKIGTFDSWEIIDEHTAIKTCDKSFFEHNGSGVPKGICWFFDAEDMQPGETKNLTLVYGAKQYSLKVANDSTDRRRVRIFWNAELGKIFNESRNSLVKVAFTKGKPQTYEITLYGGEKEMTIKEKVEAIKAYIADKGFNYEGDLIENFYLSLKSKPFVILAGTSGTGKTRLVKLFAEAIGAEMKLVPVRPDWSDSSDLFGHTDLSNHFHPGAIIDFIKKAEWNKEKPFFLCLDEMNLARVEYYLSDFLSIIETRDRKENGDIETDPLVDVDYYKDEAAQGKYGRVFIPENLYIIGTVNMDETTFPFSKKVLDRANTIEFSFVNLMAKSTKSFVEPKKLNENNAFLKTEYLYLQDCDDDRVLDAVCFDLEALNQILVKANLHVGYRVRDEILFYMMNNKKADLLSEDVAFDHEIMQKILPRIQGSSAAIKDVLSELFVKCAGDYSGFSGVSAFEQMNSYIDQKDCKYPNSAKKIAFMMRRFEEDGFTSYWL